MSLFKNKYRVESARLPGWDYSTPGKYFITICVANRENLFGVVVDGVMVLNELGTIVNEEWKKSFEIRQELECDCFVIMPNHLHAVVVINPAVVSDVRMDNTNRNRNGRDARPCVSTVADTDTDMVLDANVDVTGIVSSETTRTKMNGLMRSPKSISSFVAGFKSSATKRINEKRNMPGVPGWQSRFHDKIIWGDVSLESVRTYIKMNPINWSSEEQHLSEIDEGKVELSI